MSSDHGSGSLTVENCEVYDCGGGDADHQLYIATDEEACPRAVFRLQFCYIHDGRGGNNVKSRAERNNIYSNWISNAFYHNLDLVGADPASSVPADRAREDSDVVGNVLIAARNGRNVRIGGDGTGQSNGRYRFLNNTFIHRSNKPESQIHARFGVESVEMHNNVFFLLSGAVFEDARAEWVGGVRRVSGAANWVHRSARGVPAQWVRTIAGVDAGFSGLKPAAPGGGIAAHRRRRPHHGQSARCAVSESAGGCGSSPARGAAADRWDRRGAGGSGRAGNRGLCITLADGGGIAP